MEADALESWLRRRARREARREVALALAGLGVGCHLLLLSGIAGAGLLWAGLGWLEDGLPVVLERRLEFAFTWSHFWGLTAGVILLLFAGNSRSDREAFLEPGELDWRDSLNVGRVLRSIAGVGAELLNSGPRVTLAGWAAGQRARGWRRMDFPRTARVLFELHGHAGRVPLRELARALPDVDLPAALAELRLLRGVLVLDSPPPGVSLSGELRRQLGLPPRWADAPGMPEPAPSESEPTASRGPRSAKPPAFRCVECRRKFRLRNLRGCVTFACPLCGAPYRTTADAHGRVSVESCTAGAQPLQPEATVRPAGCHVVLGVAADASTDEIKQAYRRLMKAHHPDHAAGLSEAEQAQAEERSKEINRAYARLLGKA